MTLTTYQWDPVTDQLLSEDDGTTRTDYTHEPNLYGDLLSQTDGTNTHFYHFDARGDTRQLTDETEAVTDSWTYDAWGNIIGSTGSQATRYLFQGWQMANTDHATSTIEFPGHSYEPRLARYIGTISLGFLPSVQKQNPYRLAFTHNEIESRCYRVMMATIAGWRALNNHCAADLMAASFSGVAVTCPESCKDTLRRRGFNYISYCASHAFNKIGDCNSKNSIRFHTSGSHSEPNPGTPKLNSPSSDLFYGLGKFEWSADGYCHWNCGANTILSDDFGRECCPCSGICGYEVVIKDTYDFKQPPPIPPSLLNPPYCAQWLHSRGRLKSVGVHCPIGLISQQAIRGHRCDFCRGLRSDDPVIPGLPRPNRPYDLTDPDGYCPGTGVDSNGNIIFRNPEKTWL
ncbi:MAG: hypothetical protein KDA91_24360 [Planctomycetaceae bacterium]|nr:hypothetical protein [Planctomycetaceae bacterium]